MTKVGEEFLFDYVHNSSEKYEDFEHYYSSRGFRTEQIFE